MDNAVEEYLKSIPESEPDMEWEFQETNEFGQDGWTISYRHKSIERDA